MTQLHPSESPPLKEQRRNLIEGAICPACGSTTIYRSRSRNLLERAMRLFLHARPARCQGCSKRFLWTQGVMRSIIRGKGIVSRT